MALLQNLLKALFFIIFLNEALVHCLYTKYQITELDTSDSTFLIELASWTSPNLISSSITYSDCGGSYLIQGYNILGPGAQKNMYYQRIFTDLPTHNMIYLTFDTWVIDSVDAVDYFQVSFDGVVINSWTNGFTATKTEFLCGGATRRDIPNVQTFITQAHSAKTLTLKVISQCDQVSTDEAFGFKNFRLIFAQAPTITASTFCATPPTGYKLVQTAKACPCSIGQYLVYNTTVCGSCDEACTSCFGPTAQQCYECASGYNFDGIQCVKCDSSCATCNGPNSDQCNTCTSGKVLYNSKYCVDASVCSSPLTTTTDAFGNLYCAYTCTDSQYLIWDGKCIDSCESPLKQVTNATGSYCLLPCATPYEFYHEDTQICTEECNTWVETRQGIYYICGPTPYSLMRPLHYMRYLAIDMPDPFQNITVMRANNLLSLRASPSTFAKAKAKFVSVVIPAVFLRYGVSSSFIVNFLDDLILLAIVLIFAMIFVLLEVVCKSSQCDVGQLIFERLRVFTGFNLPILLIAINAGDIVLFSSIEFRSFDSNYPNSSISLVVAIIMLVLVAILLLGSAWLSFQAYKVKNPERYHYIIPYIQFQAKWQGFQILFKGMRGDKWYTQMFFSIYCFRTILPMIWSALLYKSPLAQTIINSVTSIAMLLYLYFTRPLRRRSSFLNVFIFELLLFVANVSSIVLVGLNKAMSLNEFAKTFFADLILVCNLGFSVLAVVALLFKISRAVDIALYFRKKHSLQQRSAWMQLFLIPFQQGGFGFEEVQVDRIVEGDLEETEMINLIPTVSNPVVLNNNQIARNIFNPARRKDIVAEPIQEEDEYVVDDMYQPRKGYEDTSRFPLQNNRTILDQTNDGGSFANSKVGDSAYGSFPIKRMADKSRVDRSMLDDANWNVKLARQVEDDF